jgi:hypothetical protein
VQGRSVTAAHEIGLYTVPQLGRHERFKGGLLHCRGRRWHLSTVHTILTGE